MNTLYIAEWLVGTGSSYAVYDSLSWVWCVMCSVKIVRIHCTYHVYSEYTGLILIVFKYSNPQSQFMWLWRARYMLRSGYILI